MSEENVELVRECFDAFNAFVRNEMTEEDITRVARRLVDPQFEFHWHSRRGMFPDEPQQIEGFPAFMAFWEQVRSAFVDFVMEPLEFIEAPDDRVLIHTRQSGRGRESGVPVEGQFFQVWTFRDGKLREGEVFVRRADALEAAGLRE